jgi:hypothetical protein
MLVIVNWVILSDIVTIDNDAAFVRVVNPD